MTNKHLDLQQISVQALVKLDNAVLTAELAGIDNTSVSASCDLPCCILSVVLSSFSVVFSMRSRWPADVS